jgi:DUF4097 and DUF4098 domain-containing protein YvlB
MHLSLNFKTLVTCAALVLASAETYAATLEDTLTQELSAASLEKLELSTVNGGITCVGSETDTITIIATKKVRARDEEMARTIMEQVEVDIQTDGGVLRVKTKVPESSGSFWKWLTRQHVDASVSYQITGPSTFFAKLTSVNGGIKVDSLRGGVSMETVNGGIHGEQLSGAVRARTVNGAIHCELAKDSLLENSSYETVNGGIKVGLPKDAAFEMKISTVNGRIHSDFVSSAESEKKRGKLEGSINGGGSKVKLSTVNGSASIHALGS